MIRAATALLAAGVVVATGPPPPEASARLADARVAPEGGGQRYTPAPIDIQGVGMTSTCRGEAAADVDRGTALLHSFWYEEALKSFERAADADPDCALAYWGQAMTWTHPLWDAPSRAALERGLQAVRRGRSVRPRDARERAWLDAVAAMYEEHGTASQHARMLAYSGAMQRLHEVFPADRNATAFYALSLLSLQGSAEYGNELQAARLLETVFGGAPDHPGAAHYLIHAYDNPPYARRGLPAADKYASLAPAAPHALHMPSHIYARLGLWDKAAASNAAAWTASDAHARSGTGGHRDRHSLQWWLYAELQRGRFVHAGELLALARSELEADRAAPGDGHDRLGAGYYLADMEARYVLERHRWDEAMALEARSDARDATSTLWYARGVGAARAAWPGGNAPLVARASEAARALEGLAGSPLAALQAVAVRAAIAASHEERDELQVLLTHATDLEDRITRPGQPSYPIIPVHELAGDLWLQLHRYRDAAREYTAALARYPRRARSVYGLARASAAAGDEASARRAYAELLDIWAHADADRPELKHATDYLARPAK